jgi:hypothetical protein
MTAIESPRRIMIQIWKRLRLRPGHGETRTGGLVSMSAATVAKHFISYFDILLYY